MVDQVDLSGTWRATVADEARLRDLHDPGFDDGDWATASVPGHWRSDPAFGETDGPVVYRTAFASPGRFGPGHEPDPGDTEGLSDPGDRRSWLVLDGIFYTSDVWLDGTYLGDTEGYFFAHDFEVGSLLDGRSEHALAVEVACARPADLAHKRNLTGVFQDWDLLDQDWNPGGIWRPVRLEQSGPVRVRHWRVRCREVTDQAATLALRVVLDTVAAETVELITRVVPHVPGGRPSALDGREHRRTQSLAAGENRVEWTVNLPHPRRWWPRALGDQPLYDVEVEVRTEAGALSDRRRLRTGLRTVEMHNWITSVNGERLFLKGANQGPTRMALAEATPAEMAADVALAGEAGLDFLRLHAHVARPELYAAADEAGLLLWQDLPLQHGYSRGVRGQARRQAREAVDLLAHHPSVFVWCGHNEPMAVGAVQALPSWNRTLLDRAVKSVLERNDGTRPVIAHSGVLPHPPQLDGTDAHLYFGWRTGDDRDLGPALARWPRLARFVSELGAEAVPVTDGFVGGSRWPDLDWDRLARHHGLQKVAFDRHVPPDAFERYEDWKAATQIYQARLLRYQIETLRRLKYRPTGGFAQFVLADSSPTVGFSVLDHERVPKPGFEALRAACRPVIVVAERPPPHVHPGERLHLDIHVVSDDRIAHGDMILRAHLRWQEEVRHVWSWQGDIPADECVWVGTLAIDVPDLDPDAVLPGDTAVGTAVTDPALVIDLELVGDGIEARSTYGTYVLLH